MSELPKVHRGRSGGSFGAWVEKLIPPLGHRAWWLLFGYTLQKLGSGLASPFLVIYLSEVRGINLATAGLVLSVASVAGVLGVPFAGWLVDRIGAGWTVVATLVIAAAGAGGFAAVHLPTTAFVVGFLFGAGTAGMWNAFASLLAVAVTPEQRGNVFGVAFMLQNLGLGLGAAIGGLVANLSSLRSFLLIFSGNAVLYLLFGALIIILGEARRPSQKPLAEATVGEPTPQPVDHKTLGYRAALADRALIGIAVLNALFAAVSTSFRNTAFPTWAAGPAGASTRVLGLAFLANTFVVVIAQLFVLRFLLEGRRRTRATASAALLFGLSIALTLMAGKSGRPTLTAVGLIVALAVLGIGDTMLQPSLYAMVNDLAPDSLRGRYNAVFNLAYQVGPVVGPAVAGMVLGRGYYELLFTALVGACVLVALFSVGLERVLPSSVAGRR